HPRLDRALPDADVERAVDGRGPALDTRCLDQHFDGAVPGFRRRQAGRIPAHRRVRDAVILHRRGCQPGKRPAAAVQLDGRAGEHRERCPAFGATDPQSALYTQGIEWGGFSFAFYSITCFLVALALPTLAALTSRKTVHAAALTCGAVGLLAVYFIQDKHLLLLSMVGVGVAWASILSMPYAILSTALPPSRMGVYMGVFNFFIVIPEIVAAIGFGPLIRLVFGESNPSAPLYVVMLGGACLLTAAACVGLVRDVGAITPTTT